MEKALVRIHARLCGDGNISVYKTSEPDRNRRGVIVYTNLIQENLDEFQSDMSEIFGVDMSRREKDVRVKSLRIVEELDRLFGNLRSGEWRIPQNILSTDTEKRLAWARAFIRDEGYHEERYDRLRIKSMNKKGLEDAQQLLSSIGVQSDVTGPNCDDSFYLTISQVSEYDEIYKIACKKPKVRE